MAIKGLSSNEREDYICRDDPARTREDGATIFVLKPIPAAVMAKLHDMQGQAEMSFGDTNTQRFINQTAKRNLEAFRLGVDDWENFLDDKDEKIPFESEQDMQFGEPIKAVARQALNRVRTHTINEVGGYIYSKNALSEEQRKNLEALSSALGGGSTSNVQTAPPTTNATEGATNEPEKATTGSTRSTRTKMMTSSASGTTAVPAAPS